jgi:hypothetical protein
VTAIDAGGGAAGSFVPDADFAQGNVFSYGGYKRALVRQFMVTANSSGQIVIAFTQRAADNLFIRGIEVYAN